MSWSWNSDLPAISTDIDECKKNTDNCSLNRKCENSPGSFSCKCKSGFQDGPLCIGKDSSESTAWLA